MVSPSIATDEPSRSSRARSVAVSFAVWVHVLPLRANTNTDPRPWSSFGAPTTAVSPSTATEEPKSSDAAPPVASSLCSAAAAVPTGTTASAATATAAATTARADDPLLWQYPTRQR